MKTKPILLTLLLLVGLIASLAGGAPQQIGVAKEQPAARPEQAQAVALTSPQAEKEEQGLGTGAAGEGIAESDNEQFFVPTNPNAHPELVTPGQPTGMTALKPQAPTAPGDFAVYSDAVIPPSAYGNSYIWMVAEPSVGGNGRVIYLSGNKFASVSGDYGKTWTWVDSFTKFPLPTGLTQFCCDQSVFHDRTHNLTFWLLQYHRQNPTVSGHNAITLAVAHGQREAFEGTWTTYTITPQQTEPVTYSDNNWWFDYPDVAVSNNYLYITINPNNGPSQNAVAFRLSLDTLASGGALPTSWPHFIAPNGFLRPTQGATDTMYFVQHIDNMTERIWTWPEASSTPTYVDRTVNAWNNTAAHATCGDGTNWLAYSLNVVQTAWVAKGKIGAMWNSAEGGGFPLPQVRYALFDQATLNPVSQGSIWSTGIAWGFPSVNVDDRGDIGGTIGAGCGGGAGAPQLQAWIADSYNSDAIQPLTNTTIAVGTNGPADARWGDYYVTRRMVPYSNTWIGTGVVMNGGSDSLHTAVHMVWFGREQDRPPVNATIYANAAYTSSYQDGTQAHPFHAAADGNYACSAGDNLYLQAGVYHEYPITLDRACTIHAQNGTAVIGQH